MGKRPDELNVSDAPLDAAPRDAPDPRDPRATEWYRFTQDIEDLLNTGRYNWAEPTLRDIALTVERTQRVTEGQKKAIANIEAARQKGRRRYEGYWRRL